MSLQFTFHKLQVGIPRLPGMLFSFTIRNPNPCISCIWSYHFELYQAIDPGAAEIRFLGPLVANLPFLPDWLNDLQQERPCELVWNYERKDIQRIEDVRRDDVHFEIKGNLLVASDYEGGNAVRREVAWVSPQLNYAYPIRLKIPQSDWVTLLDEMKFTHILLHEFPAPTYHPAFARSAAHWRDAWEHHRKNEPDAALTECFKAFECLGFDLSGSTAVTRRQLIQSLLAQEAVSKQEKFLAMLEKVQDFMHLSRHAGNQPAKVNRDDSEMMLLCAASLLGYLSKHHSRVALNP